MKALIVYRVNIEEPSNRGVSLKMQGQCWGLQRNGYEVDCMFLNSKGIMKNEKLLQVVPSGGVKEVLMKYKGFYNALAAEATQKPYDLYIIRFTTLTPSFLRLLSVLRKERLESKIILDLPTFPYDQEWSGIKGRIVLSIDKLFREKLSKYVDYFIHYGAEREVMGISCINMSNGMLPYPVRERQFNQSEKINLLAIGKWQYWHGLDRLLEGLSNYSGPEKIELHVVGEGSALGSYKRFVEEKGLEEKVTFHGSLTGIKLEELIDQANLGIGTLALYRKGVVIDSSLKHRTYCMNGLPFILGSEDLDFPVECGFVKYFPGEENIDLDEVLDFLEEIKKGNREIQEYGREKLDWGVKMKRVIQRIAT